MLKSSDIRIVEGDFNIIIDHLEQYLETVNFEVTEKKLQKSECFLVAENRNKSFFKLFWTAIPQITNWRLEKKTANEIKVEAKVASFRPFKYYFYGIFIYLLFWAHMFFIIALSIKKDTFLYFKTYSIFLGLVIFASCFFLYFVRTKPYAIFFDTYYNTLKSLLFKKEQTIQLHSMSPEIIPGTTIFILFAIAIFISISDFKIAGNMLLGGIFLFIITISLLGVILIYEEKTVRTIFLLNAIYICVPLTVYSNLPMVGLSAKPVFKIVNEVVKKNNELEKRLKENPEIAQKMCSEIREIKQEIYKISVFSYVFFLIIIVVIWAVLLSALALPIEILRRIGKFNTNYKESLYFRAMKSENTINPFNCCIIGIWILLGAANLSGLYLSFAVLFKTFGFHNFIIKSQFADLFFDGSSMMLSYIFPDNMNINRLHTFLMLAYSIPMLFFYSLVVIKNIKSTLQIKLVLKSNQNAGILSDLMPKMEKICQNCKLRLPIIKIIDSVSATEGASYLGFPFFRNLLIIRKQTVEILSHKDYALEAYLAHEIFHLKKHTLGWKILCLLSDFTLFGNGFLTILHSSYNVELEADAFAVKWLKQHDMPPTALITALQSQEQLEEQEVLGTLLSNLNFIHSIENEEYRETIIMQADNSGRLKKMLINLKLLYQMYFGNYITSYIHPGNDYRIEQIEERISESM